ncbi:MAG: flippase-like domain-containing protein [Chloroflexi bacterium]|nr:flippase-like domain-containing protein [Chloroflexota bacterium]
MALLWRGGGLQGVIESVRGIHPIKVGGLLLVYAASLLLLGLRWHTLVRMAGGSPGWASSAEVFLTSVIVNYAAPIGLAVPTRAALTVRDLDMNPGQSGAVVGWEAALDLLVLALISVAWLVLGGLVLLQSMAIDSRFLAIGATAAVLGAIALGVLARSAAIRSRIAPFARRMISSPVEHPLLALLALILTAGFWLIQVGVMAVILEAFGADVAPMLLLGIMGLPMLIGMLSPVPGGAGVREALMAAAARLEGVPAGPVVLAAVAYRLALFVVTPFVWSVIRLASKSPRRR